MRATSIHRKFCTPGLYLQDFDKCTFCNFTLLVTHCFGCPGPSPRSSPPCTFMVTTLLACLHGAFHCGQIVAFGSRTVRPWSLLPTYTHGRLQGGPNGHFPLEIATTNQVYLENLKLVANFRLIHWIVAMTVYLPVWHWHCTKSRFTVLVSCNDEIAVHSCPLLCEQRVILGNVGTDCSIWFLLRNNNTAIINLQTFTSSYGSRRFSACDQQGSHCVFFTMICFFSRPTFPALIINNCVKSGLFEVLIHQQLQCLQ